MLTDEMKKSVKDLVKEILSEKPATEAAAQPAAEDIEKAKKEKEDKEKADKDKDEKEKADKDKKPAFMKKSETEIPAETPAPAAQAEASEIGKLSDEEVELVKAWRASKDEPAEEIGKSQEAAPKQDEELKKALDAQKTENETLKKSIEAQSELIKGLTDKVEKMASQPAYDKKAVTKLEPIEKSQPETEKASKRQVLNALLELQQAGEATSHDVSKYESTNQLSKSLQEKVKTQILKGK